jgi:hypothetical protein
MILDIMPWTSGSESRALLLSEKIACNYFTSSREWEELHLILLLIWGWSREYGNLRWKLVLESIIPLSFVLGFLASARLNSPRIFSIQFQHQILCGLVCTYLDPLTWSAPSWSSHCVVMAACCCCLWWRWWSYALWATLIRLWLHLLSCYLWIVVLEMFSVISKIWSSSFISKLEDIQLESWMYMCTKHNSLPEVMGGLLYAYRTHHSELMMLVG